MLTQIKRLLDESAPDLRGRLVTIYAVLIALNLGAWLWALLSFYDKPALLGVALVVYGLGLRHAVDADHIAAIDNVTRKLMQARQRPVTIGFFFAMGHSTVVVIAAGAVALAASLLDGFDSFQSVSGVIGTAVSALFLFAIAAMNIVILVSIYRSYRQVRRGGAYVEQDLDMLLNNRGFLARIFRPVFRLVTRSWHMFPLGFLFGLGFDTATEVAVFGVSAAQATKGVPFEAILVFPLLFAAGMSLVDTTDGVMMLGAYDWAFVKPIRKLYYNMTITLVSVIVAILIGGIEALGLIGDKLGLSGGFWDAVGALNDNFNNLGFVIIGIFIAAWALSFAIYKAKRLDELDVRSA
ncbi:MULTISPECIES: HoxN/HupN/NixA family nickel/cobalt transporter [Inquilinus]|uniref:Nickel/cobalt efflux system n=1 Tax=Inquilinus ginsengisoli TaxID=363840 RepID=A0ABU1JVH2_9PROT|nr:HoxN/HupN/NixA family nickel/cobalt transporter [Inquilinus ginsengisoli]MDR6292601.1 high-affinity nickel-transport protein [Inquilinus ginsengisoli]